MLARNLSECDWQIDKLHKREPRGELRYERQKYRTFK